MRQVTAILAVGAALVAAGCGEQEALEEGRSQAQETVEQARDGVQIEGREPLDLQSLARETQGVVRDVATAASKLARDPEAPVDEDLTRAQERAERLARQARAQAGDLPQEATSELTPEQERKLRDRLVAANDEAGRTAERLRQVADPEEVRRIAREGLSSATDDVQSVAEQLGDKLPADVRRRIEQLPKDLPPVAAP